MSYKKIVIIDYNMGNLRSVYNATRFLGLDVELTSSKRNISDSYGIILPGVGAFGDAIKNIKELGLFDLIIEQINKGKPYLGICLGLQLLFETSEESNNYRGFSIFEGNSIMFQSKEIKIPHIGWNSINIKKKASNLLKDIKTGEYFYFVHSYYVKPKDSGIILATTEYGEEFVSAVNRDNIFGVQFHPEKSHDMGLKVLKNFANICS